MLVITIIDALGINVFENTDSNILYINTWQTQTNSGNEAIAMLV